MVDRRVRRDSSGYVSVDDFAAGNRARQKNGIGNNIYENEGYSSEDEGLYDRADNLEDGRGKVIEDEGHQNIYDTADYGDDIYEEVDKSSDVYSKADRADNVPRSNAAGYPDQNTAVPPPLPPRDDDKPKVTYL
ncbi:MAG: hypothetical protein KAH18_10280 [Psychromonas sp.]|nr:hypothetical protein [Psychromonas sp.]